MNPEAHSFQNMIDYTLEANIYSINLLKKFLKTISKNAVSDFPVHLKIDTGMNRLGFKTHEEINEAVQIIKTTNNLKSVQFFRTSLPATNLVLMHLPSNNSTFLKNNPD